MTDELSEDAYRQILDTATRAFYDMPDDVTADKVRELGDLLAGSLGAEECRRVLVAAFNYGIEKTMSVMPRQYAPGFVYDGYVITASNYTEAGARQAVAEGEARRKQYATPDVSEMGLFCRYVSPWIRVEL